MRRPVHIITNNNDNSYFVMFMNDKDPNKRYAAGFNKKIKNYSQVVAWVRANPKLRLVEEPKP